MFVIHYADWTKAEMENQGFDAVQVEPFTVTQFSNTLISENQEYEWVIE